MNAATPAAYDLLHHGSLALADVEHHGIRVDVAYLQAAIKKTDNMITKIEGRLKEDEVWKVWKRRFGGKAKLGNDSQLATVLFKEMGLAEVEYTDLSENRVRGDEATLSRVNLPFVKEFLRRKKLIKAKSTYLEGILGETVGDRLHPMYNLNIANTYRSSSNLPNFQNFPIRNPEMGKLIRQAFIPTDGWYLAEVDFSGIEVRVAYCVVAGTKIETIDGSQTIQQVIKRVTAGEEVYVYGYDQQKKRIAISQVLEGGLTKWQTEVWKVTLDNGESVTATSNHKFMLRNGEYQELSNLKPGDSLMPFYKENKKSRWGTVYEKVYLNNGQSMLAHNLVALDVYGFQIAGSSMVVHHANGNGTDNSLENLEIMTRKNHMRIHSKQGWQRLGKGKRFEWHRSEEGRNYAKKMNKRRQENWTKKNWEEFGDRVSEGIERLGGRRGSRNAMFGKTQTDETRRKIAAIKRGVKTGRPAWNRGMTEETNSSVKQISTSLIGRPGWNKGLKLPPISEEHKQRLREVMTGRNVAEETCRKLSANKKRYWNSRTRKTTCAICGKEMWTVTQTHLFHKHGITPKEYKETYNHKVVSVEKVGKEDVYNITVEGIHNYATSAGVIVKNCYHKDPTMEKYLRGGGDMHHDEAMSLFLLKHNEVTKKGTRDASKNMWVFPQFYGSVYFQCAPHIWEAMERRDFRVGENGITIREHLAGKGITSLGKCSPESKAVPGTFEYLLKQAEDNLWNRRFPVYAQWRRSWWRKYQEEGGFQTLTGFYCRWGKEGVLKRNDAINYPVQGAAFHCLLWALTRLNRWLKKHHMRSRIVGQIHDSILLDIYPPELQDVLATAKYIMTVEVPRHWDWIIIGLDVEADVVEPGQSWHDKKEWSTDGEGTWGPKKKAA